MDPISRNIGIDQISLSRVFEFLPYPFLVSELREKGHHNIYVNTKFIEEIGYTLEDIPTIEDWFQYAYPSPEYRQTIMNQWNALEKDARAHGKDSLLLPARIHTKHGHEIWYEVKASVQGAIHLVAFVNIDEKIKKEMELQRLNENKNRMLSILTHDLRSPLASLYSVLLMVTGGVISEREKEELLRKLTYQVFQMTEFVETTLDWTHANFSFHQPVLKQVDIRKITENMLNLYQIPISNKKLSVSVQINSLSNFNGDPEILSILIRNLLSNAIKYTPVSGHIRIYNSTRDGRLVLSVENSGNGISKDKIASILNMNYASQQGTAGEKGLGLGMKLCQQVLKNINGRLEIESPDPTTTIFRIVT